MVMKKLIVIGLICFAGIATGQTDLADEFALAELKLLVKKSWEFYLKEELASRDPRKDDSFEWFALAALRANPGNANAVTNLVSSYLLDNHLVLAVAAAEYADALGKAAFHPTIDEFRQSYEDWLKRDDSEVINLGQLDVIQAARQRKNTIVTPEYYAAVIPRLRGLLQEPGATLPVLLELAFAYNQLDEPQMVCMLTALILKSEPLHKSALPMHMASLLVLQERRISTHTIRNYLNMKNLGKGYYSKLSHWCLDLKLRYEAKQFLEAWVKAEPTNPEGWEMLGQILVSERDYQPALVAFTRAVKAPDHPPSIYLRLAELASLKADMPGMEAWLSRYRKHVEPAAFEEVLEQNRFKRFPELRERLGMNR
ncbi:MAG: tetratricopeptide (TPR) repeat protein [Candidatus Omnitrophota bacterium]|jgi:tetratricopeptide (TPR) repeat protein